jgi:hypothetical protein
MALRSKYDQSKTILALLAAGGDPQIVLDKYEPLIWATMSENAREGYQEIIDAALEGKTRQSVASFVFANRARVAPFVYPDLEQLIGVTALRDH